MVTEQPIIITAYIYFFDKIALIPTNDRFENGMIIEVEPIYKINIKKEELVEIVEKLRAREPKIWPNPKNNEEFNKIVAKVYRIAKYSSWKRFYQETKSYSIDWVKKGSEKFIEVYVGQWQKEGYMGADSSQTKRYPFNTNIDLIIQEILDDYFRKTGLKES